MVKSRAVILWQRLDLPGCEVAELGEGAAGPEVHGVALLAHDGRPARLEYRIVCDAGWRTRLATIGGHVGGTAVGLELACSADGEWMVNGRPAAELKGCLDVDLGFSPSTNLLPIRRLRLAVGSRAPVSAAWVRFPELTVERLEQQYSRLGASSYRYESGGGVFRRDLTVNDDGFVLEYPDFWHAEAVTSRPDLEREP